ALRVSAQRRPEIPRFIHAHLDWQLLELLPKPRACFDPLLRERHPLRAIFISREIAQLFELCDCSFRIHGGAHAANYGFGVMESQIQRFTRAFHLWLAS